MHIVHRSDVVKTISHIATLVSKVKIAITNFLVSHMCEIRFYDVISQNPQLRRSQNSKAQPNDYVLKPYFLLSNLLDAVM